MRQYPRIISNCRRLAQMHQFSTEPFQIMLACLQGGGLKAQESYQITTLQKFILRELRLYEAAANGGRFHYSVKDRRWAEERRMGLSDNLGDDLDQDDEEDDEEDEDENDDGEGTGKKGKGKSKSKNGKKADKAWARGKRYDIEYDGDGVLDVADHEALPAEGDVVPLDPRRETEGSVAPTEGENDLTGPVPIKPTTESPMWNFMYGQMMLTARSHHTSLCELIRDAV
jgi:hypothetical protein